MLVTIHQPEHLPWLGFFNKADQADILVLLDTVQFRKNYFQNRNRILTSNGPSWLTVPVLMKGHISRTIKDMEIDCKQEWHCKHWRSIEVNYCKHKFFRDYGHFFKETYKRPWHLLAELNEHVIRFFFEALGIKTKIVRASDLGVSGSSSDLLLDICLKMKADAYLAGQSAQDYLDETIFLDKGIEIVHHKFNHPEYAQRGQNAFVSHLSTLDLIMNAGGESIYIIRSGSGDAA